MHFYNFSAKAWRNFVVNYTDIVSLCAIGDGFSAIFRKSSAGAGGSRDCRIQRREIKPQLQPADSQLAHAGGCGPGELAGDLRIVHEERIGEDNEAPPAGEEDDEVPSAGEDDEVQPAGGDDDEVQPAGGEDESGR